MSIRSRVRPWTAVVVIALGLAALATAAVKAERAESNKSQLQQRASDIETDLRALWVLSDKSGRPMSDDQSKAAAAMRTDVRESLASATALSASQFKSLQAKFDRYDESGHETITPVLAPAGIKVENSDTDALQAMLTESQRLKKAVDASLASAKTRERNVSIAFAATLIAAFVLLAALLVPSRRAAFEARKRARELSVQREMEERFQPVFERHPQGMWIFDENTLEFLAVNETMVKRYGYSREELLSMKTIDLHPDKTRGEAKRHIERRATEGRSWLHRTKAGEEIEVEVQGRSMSFGGRAARMALAIDVTERNRISRALAESEERHRTVVETAQEGIVVYGLDGAVQLMNTSMGEILGLDPEEQKGRQVVDTGTSIEAEALELSMTPGFAELVSKPQEVLLERADGSERVLSASSSAWRDTDGNVKGTVVMCSDITVSKLSEERIRESEALKSAMLDSSLDGIYTINAAGEILEFNRAAEQMFQIPREEAIGRAALELLVPVERRAAANAKFGPLMTAGKQGRIVAVRLTGWRADGTEFPAEFTVASTDGGEALATIHVRDITERDERERILKARARQQAAVADLGAFSLQAQTMDEVYQEAGNAIQRALGVEFLQVSHFEPDDDDINVCVLRGWERPTFTNRRVGIPTRFSERLTEGPVVTETATTNSPAKPMMVAAGVRSGLVVGVVVDGELRGSLAVHSKLADVFGRDEQIFMKAVANVVGAALARDEAQERMRDLALHDSLTRLPNRAVFEERLIEWANTAEKPAAVAFVDVDHFKVLNDALGHQAGDQLLCALAPRFAQALGESALVARFGGDEFVVLVENVEDEAVAKILGERLLDKLTAPVDIDGRPHHVSVSVGVKLVQPGADDLQSAVRDADSAMYQAKERGRDRVEVFDKALHQRVVDRLRVDRDMRQALGRDDELWCAYQPLISSETREIVGIEALARWHHPELGELAPVEFIPAAEELGLIGSLGWYVLERAVRDAAAWVQEGGAVADAAFVSVNLSPQQLADPSLAPRISVLLDDVGLPPRRLTLEVTETTLMADTDSAQRGLEELAALGVRLVLDDFGTGFSSMAYLSRMPVSGIKVDRSFISGLGESGSSEAIVKAIVSMADALELEVVAEGVETEKQAAAAIAIGCDKLQGFLFSRPVPASEIGKLAGSLAASPAAAA